MRAPWILAVLVAAAGCAHQSFADEMKAACDAHECPADPPDYINCMPPIFPDLEPVCGGSCRDFLAHTCMIPFVE